MKLSRLATVVAALMMPLAAFAESIIEEVVVTATKRSESIQDVGLSMTAFDSNALQDGALFDSAEVLQRVPNLELQLNGAAAGANIFLRGMGTSGPAFNQLSGVGIYADEVSLN